MSSEKAFKLDRLTENLVFTAKEKEPKTEILYIRANSNLLRDLKEMQKHFKIEKRTDLVRAILEDAAKTFTKMKEEQRK